MGEMFLLTQLQQQVMFCHTLMHTNAHYQQRHVLVYCPFTTLSTVKGNSCLLVCLYTLLCYYITMSRCHFSKGASFPTILRRRDPNPTVVMTHSSLSCPIREDARRQGHLADPVLSNRCLHSTVHIPSCLSLKLWVLCEIENIMIKS